MDSLYVGDLHPDVTESMLLERFNSFGRVYSIHLCRDKRTGTSRRYAFVNFQQRADAERALELLNFATLLGQPMRMMWSQRDSSLRRVGNNVGNIFIKNLEKSIDSMALYDVFSTFGNVLSCKVECDENGSRGYGYVHFERAEAAEAAIRRLNGMLFNDQKVFIAHFKSRQERQPADKMTAKDVSSKEMHVIQVQEKEERCPKLTHKSDQCVNLCVKNLDVSVDDECLRKKFSPFGTIINAKVIRSNGFSSGFGFVCFSSLEEATNAKRAMHGRMLVRKPLNITVIRRKEERQASLTRQEMQTVQNPGLSHHHQPAPPSGKIMDAIAQAQNSTARTTSMQQIKPRPSTRRATLDIQQCFQKVLEVNDPAVRHLKASQEDKKAITTVMDAVPETIPATLQATVQAAVKRPGPTRVPSAVKKTVLPAVPTAVKKAVQVAVPVAVPDAALAADRGKNPATTPATFKVEQLTKDMMGGEETEQPQDTHTPVSAPNRKPLTIYMLESADVDEQIRMLHEHMFPLVEKIHPTRAKDITWMMIQGENNYDLLNMIGNPDLLRSQVEQIVVILRAREAGQDVCLRLCKNKNKKRRKKKHVQ